MKNEFKNKRGITLIALIITIILLLILAVVTISAVNEGSLFNHANNAATAYDKAAKDENTMISNYLTELAKHDGNSNESGEENIFKGKTFKIYAVDYNNNTIVSDVVLRNIGDNTLEMYNDGNFNSVKYKYDNFTHMLNLYVADDEDYTNPLSTFPVYILENNIVIKVSTYMVATSNGGVGTTGLTGYKYINERNETSEFKIDPTTNVGYMYSIDDEEIVSTYFLIGNEIIFNISKGTVTESNGIYTSYIVDGDEPRNLIPPQ